MGGSREKASMNISQAIQLANLQDARQASANDGKWRILLVNNSKSARLLVSLLNSAGGFNGTETFDSGGRVTVTSASKKPFGEPGAILIVMGIWETPEDSESLRRWRESCSIGRGYA